MNKKAKSVLEGTNEVIIGDKIIVQSIMMQHSVCCQPTDGCHACRKKISPNSGSSEPRQSKLSAKHPKILIFMIDLWRFEYEGKLSRKVAVLKTIFSAATGIYNGFACIGSNAKTRSRKFSVVCLLGPIQSHGGKMMGDLQ